ncbi:MAG: hypothetical protein GY804_02010 [Alphaproteobacteria bacterium]|nr:hypothetical protein [Alphaproteobacteria bacterium]
MIRLIDRTFRTLANLGSKLANSEEEWTDHFIADEFHSTVTSKRLDEDFLYIIKKEEIADTVIKQIKLYGPFPEESVDLGTQQNAIKAWEIIKNQERKLITRRDLNSFEPIKKS